MGRAKMTWADLRLQFKSADGHEYRVFYRTVAVKHCIEIREDDVIVMINQLPRTAGGNLG
jgi:hypothetical protein